MRRAIPLVLLLLSIFTTPINAQNRRYDDSTEALIKAVENSLVSWVRVKSQPEGNLEDRMKTLKVHGLTIAVIKNYQLHWTRGYGFADTADKRPVIPQTLFQAASISKSLNAMGVLRLVQNKQIDLTADINNYLKSWKFPYDTVSHNKKISTANLLSHTAGLTVHGFAGYEWKDSLPSDNQILEGKRPSNSPAVKSAFEPGLRYQYSGGGTTISKKIIMDISNEPYDKYMEQKILKPIGMNQSFYTQPPPPTTFRNLATAYHADGKPVNSKFHIYPEQAADGLWTNPTDLSKFIIEMQLSLQGKSNKILSKETTTTMLTPFIDKSAALGVFIEERGGQKYFQHSGGNEGFRCQYYGSLENGNGLVIMVNSDNGQIIGEIMGSIAKNYGWKDFYKIEERTTVKMNIDTLKSYVGTYVLAKDSIEIKFIKDHLEIVETGGSLKLYFTSPTEFFITEVRAEATFVRKEDKIHSFILKQGGRTATFIKAN
ncbi:MAG: beta-lactamase family protein [Gemmatimonadaceae bacterium]|nr:beta-lactamase family protein [Chitinophagaceae bacterium]